MIKRLKSTSFLYSLSSILKSGIQLFSGLAVAMFVLPEDYGIWTSLNLIVTYSAVFKLGVVNGINLEIPLSLGNGDFARANRLVETAYAYFLACGAFFLIISGAYLTFINTNLSTKYVYGLLGVISISILTIYQEFLVATFRNKDSFRRLSYINIFQALSNLLALLLIVYYSYYGLIAKSVLVLLIYVIFLHFYRPFKVRPRFLKSTFFELTRVGLPIFGLAYIQAAALSFDRVLLIKFTDTKTVGLYSFAYLSFTSISLFSASIASYIYPMMSFMYAESGDKRVLWMYIKRNITYLTVGLLVLATLGSLIAPYIIENYFPSYISSVRIMQILFFAGALYGSVIGVNVLLSLKKWSAMIFYHLFFSFLLLICPVIMLATSLDKSIGVAYGVLIATFVNFFVAYFIVYFVLVLKNE